MNLIVNMHKFIFVNLLNASIEKICHSQLIDSPNSYSILLAGNFGEGFNLVIW